MSQASHEQKPIVPREKLDFGLDQDIPRHWMGGDPFKTRFFDAMSTVFPVGERFFIVSVRNYKDRVADPQLQHEVKGFTRQEAQHSMVHLQYNERLKAQGVNIDAISQRLEDGLFGDVQRLFSERHRLAMTAAFEHLTAMMCTCFFERRELLDLSDPRIRAVFAWHAIEEVEHKAVAFDVLEQAAGAGYWPRVLAMMQVTFGFPIFIAVILHHMLKVDGHGFFKRLGLWAKGLWWFWKPGGLFSNTWGYYFSYYRPGFHPWQNREMPSYGIWLKTFEGTGDAVAAGNALHAAGA